MGKLGQVESKIDYWEFTVPYQQADRLGAVFPGGREVRRNERGDLRGWRGYTHSADLAVGSGLVGWSPARQEMGVHVSLSGEALALLAGNADPWGDLPAMIAFIHDDLGGHTTRLDCAFDDKIGLLDLDLVGEALRSGDFVARWKDWKYYQSSKGGVLGETYYLGSGRSDSQLRVYDKRAERLQKGHGEQVEGVPHWIRVELQLRRKRAHAAAVEVKAAGARVWWHLAGVLRGMVEFKQPGTSSQKTRWEPAAWWLRFLGGVEKARLVVDRQVRTLDNVRSWVLGQVAPSLAVLEQGMGFDAAWSFLYQVAQEGHKRLGPRHRAIIAAGALVGA